MTAMMRSFVGSELRSRHSFASSLSSPHRCDRNNNADVIMPDGDLLERIGVNPLFKLE
jgi:hypothetical protein